jgi:Amt family ammonium transporter
LHQLQLQAVGVIATLVYSGAVSWILLKGIDVIMGLRVKTEDERDGLDISLHGEQVL